MLLRTSGTEAPYVLLDSDCNDLINESGGGIACSLGGFRAAEKFTQAGRHFLHRDQQRSQATDRVGRAARSLVTRPRWAASRRSHATRGDFRRATCGNRISARVGPRATVGHYCCGTRATSTICFVSTLCVPTVSYTHLTLPTNRVV